jgi:hypothetical protein
MNWLRILPERLRATFVKRRMDRALDEELQWHLDMLIEQHLERGLAPDAARRAARQGLGGADQIKEFVRDTRGFAWVESIARDIRYGARMLRQSPGFTAVAVLTLALGIGANTAIFSVIDAVFLKRLPFPHSERIVMVWEDVHLPHYQNSENTPAPGNFADWKKRKTVFSSMAASFSSL